MAIVKFSGRFRGRLGQFITWTRPKRRREDKKCNKLTYLDKIPTEDSALDRRISFIKEDFSHQDQAISTPSLRIFIAPPQKAGLLDKPSATNRTPTTL